MMNVVFKPKHLTPWALQKEFLRAVKEFYSLGGAMKMFRLYGADAGFRRLDFWVLTRLGLPFVEWQSGRWKSNIRDILNEECQGRNETPDFSAENGATVRLRSMRRSRAG